MINNIFSENALRMATTSPFIIATKKLLARNGSNIGSKSGAGKCTWNLDGMTVRGMSTLKGSSPGNIHQGDPYPYVVLYFT